MAALPVGKGYTPAQWEAWFAANTNPANPRYTGNAKAGSTQLAGKTWAQVYAALYAYGQTLKPKATPDEAGASTEALAGLEALGVAAGTAATGAAGATSSSATGLEKASYLPSWADGLAAFLSALTSAATWIRVVKVVTGGALLIIGVAHMTGASNAVAQAARKVPLPV